MKTKQRCGVQCLQGTWCKGGRSSWVGKRCGGSSRGNGGQGYRGSQHGFTNGPPFERIGRSIARGAGRPKSWTTATLASPLRGRHAALLRRGSVHLRLTAMVTVVEQRSKILNICSTYGTFSRRGVWISATFSGAMPCNSSPSGGGSPSTSGTTGGGSPSTCGTFGGKGPSTAGLRIEIIHFVHCRCHVHRLVPRSLRGMYVLFTSL